VGKQFTAYAVVRLAQQGKLSLDDEVRKAVSNDRALGLWFQRQP
jgi:CubicO group peptidase (beta-lactamase class C family)